MARSERSCGIVIFHEAPDARREYLLLHYPTGHWDFAKGHVEKGEDDLATAVREAREETGLSQIEIVPEFKHEFEYFYQQRSTRIHKRVRWFLGRSLTKRVAISHEHRGFVWLPFDDAIDRVTYANAKELLRQAEDHLSTKPRNTWF